MTVLFFKFGLPVILGYALFVAIAGRLNPIARPRNPADRPSWLLGLWIGLAVSGVAGLTFYLAHNMHPVLALNLIIPGTALLAALVMPAFIVFLLYTRHIHNSETKTQKACFDWILHSDDLEIAATFDPEIAVEHPLDLLLEQTNAALDATLHSDDDETPALEPRASLDQSMEQIEESQQLPVIADREDVELAAHHGDHAEVQAKLEDKLTSSINECSRLEALVEQEKNQRIDLEETVEELRKGLVNAKQEIRRGTAARAKALSTANKSIAFARQTVQIRSRLESELEQAKDTIKNRQATVSSLIRALEKEKRRSEEELTAKAKQLILHEKQMQAKRSLEEVARSVENKLTTRLVKKVAKARPLMSDLDDGKTRH